MGNEIVLTAEKVSKKFCRDLRRGMHYGIADVSRSFFGLPTKPHLLRAGEFWAVDHVGFTLERGETLALVGSNGSGKSTLLRVLAGIYPPDTGHVEIRGNMVALMALGAGFHPLMTGRENIFLAGTILGMTKRELQAKFDEIVDFADLGDFLDVPVKTYSAGMNVRLGLAIAVHADPDILLVDEVLAVGDAQFQKKCYEKIHHLLKAGTAMILVSHSIAVIERLCSRGLLLKQGKQLFLGEVRECVRRYFEAVGADNVAKAVAPRSIGLGEVVFSNVCVYQAGGDRNDTDIEFGKDFVIQFDYAFARKSGSKTQIRLGIRTYEGHEVQKLFFQDAPPPGGGAYQDGKSITFRDAGTVRIRMLNPRLFPQTFRLDLAAMPLDTSIHLGGIANAAVFNITPPKTEQKYFEYGNMTITEFDYEVTAS
jgi:ABC-type polysaccharide/polyol phosphate transport system ATPase subunit